MELFPPCPTNSFVPGASLSWRNGRSLHLAARRTSAESIVVVQPDGNIIDILKQHKSRVLADPRIHVIEQEPRAYLDTTRSLFDVIQLAGLEGFAAGSEASGASGKTTSPQSKGTRDAWPSVRARSRMCSARDTRPERDNLKIVATWIEALQKAGAKNPENHLLLARDELSLVTAGGKIRIRPRGGQGPARNCRRNVLDVEWFPGAKSEETNRVHILPGPQGTKVSWYHHALMRLLSPERENSMQNGMTNIQPATDDKPFFLRFL